MKEKQQTFNVSVPNHAVERLRAFCGATRVQKAVLGQLIVWFSGQPQIVQRVVMGEVTEGLEAEYANALESLAAKVRASVSKKKAG